MLSSAKNPEPQIRKVQVVASKYIVQFLTKHGYLGGPCITNDGALVVIGNVCLRVIISFYDMEEGDIKNYLVSVIPGVQCSLSGVVVKHGDMKVLVVKGNVYVFVSRSLGRVSVVNFCSGQVRVGDIERPTDHEGFACIPFGVLRVPGLQDLQGVGVDLGDDNVPSVLIGRVHNPHPQFVSHNVDVGVSPPCVWVHVVEAGELQSTLGQHAACLEAVLDNNVALVLVVVKRSIVDHVIGPLPFEWEAVGSGNHSCHEVIRCLVLPHNFAVGVTVHIPDLQQRGRREMVVRDS